MNKLLREAVQVRSETFFEEITQQCSNIIIMCEKITVREVRAGGITKTLNRQVCTSHCMRFPRFLGRLCYDLLLCKQTQAGAIFFAIWLLFIHLTQSLPSLSPTQTFVGLNDGFGFEYKSYFSLLRFFSSNIDP